MISYTAKKVKTVLLLAGLICLIPGEIISQQYKLLLDTVYTSASVNFGKGVKALSVDNKLVLVENDEYKTYENVDAVYNIGPLNSSMIGSLIKRNGKIYEIDNSLQLRLKDIPDFDNEEIWSQNTSFRKNGNSFAYSQNDSVFFKHSSWESPKFITNPGWPKLLTEDHLRVDIEDSYYYYSLSNQKLLQLPEDNRPSFGIDSLILITKEVLDY